MNSHFTARNVIGNAKKAQQRVGYIHEKNYPPTPYNNGTLNSTLETCMLMDQPCYHHHFFSVCVFDHIPTVTMQLKLLLESIRWQTAAFEWTVCEFPGCPLPSCVSWHENGLYVWLQHASTSLLAYMSLLFRFSFRRSLLKPQAPAMPVSQPLLCVYLLFIPPGLSHHTTMSLMPDRKSGQFPSHVSIHFTVFTLDFSNMFGVWNSGGGEK